MPILVGCLFSYGCLLSGRGCIECLYSRGAYFQWVLIIPIPRYLQLPDQLTSVCVGRD